MMVPNANDLINTGNTEFTRLAKQWADEQTWQRMAEKYVILWQKK
jgi:hypothetical protein